MAYKANIFQNSDFSQFSASLTEAVHIAIEKFWEQDVKLKIRAMNTFRELRDEKLTTGIDFFSSQIKVENHKPIMIRLDNNFIENFFEISLNGDLSSSRSGDFRLSSMSKLEIKILNNFCEFLYKKIKDTLIPVSTAKLSEKSERSINILFYVATKNSIASNIIISIPMDRIKFDEFEKTQSFTDEDFISQSAFVTVKIGTSKITLNDLKNLEMGDIVLLEDSDIKKATLISGDFEKKFNIKPNSSLILNLEDNEDEHEDEQTNHEVIMEKNLWDDIQVEISAEFAKVKMSIGELKQITQGQIVDLGSVFENELSLFVENKRVAKGELVIINDRYAVRLNEVMSSKDKKEIAPPKKQQQPKPQTQEAPKAQEIETDQEELEQQGPDEEFDYSDFEK